MTGCKPPAMFTECSESRVSISGVTSPSSRSLSETGEVLNPVSGGDGRHDPQKEAFPLIRYRVGDITVLDDAPCACGRTHPRIRGSGARTICSSSVNQRLPLTGGRPARYPRSAGTSRSSSTGRVVHARAGGGERAVLGQNHRSHDDQKMVGHRLGLAERGRGRGLVERFPPRFEGKSKKVVDGRSL